MASPPTSGTVTVASKLPIKFALQLCVEKTVQEPVMGGGVRDVKQWYPEGPVHTLHGTAVAYGEQRKCLFMHGAALTPNIPAAFWAEWLKQNRDSAVVRNGIIFAQAKQIDVVAEAKEKIGVRTGLEPLDPTKTHRMGQTLFRAAEDVKHELDTARIEELAG